LASNAGTAGNGWIHETDLADWQSVLNVNLTGSFLCSKHAIPHMMEGGGGSIVMTSSVAGTIIGPGGAAASYAASKHGVIGLAKQIAVDYGSWNIRGNAIQPSGVEGANFGEHVLQDQQLASTPRAKLPRGVKFVPMQRRGKVREEYGASIAFLMTDDAGYITGAVLPIDGGFLSQ
ncbi:MAG: SDR family oxidoreductase, partial [Arenicellales bacterium]|nr:SDR family oxidoreductase [Arenicellales bacterium]